MANRKRQDVGFEENPLWYKDAIIYELHVRSFYDSNGDGIGDFKGLTEKLDYLQELGITAIWLLPFCVSPLKDDGYDIADYKGIHTSYGSIADFRSFLREAHQRGLRVITELVLNHTSNQHHWFHRARRAKPGSRWRDFYVWSNTYDRYKDTRIIFKDFETSNWAWDHVANAYYWHRFYSHQPDLNYDNPLVQKAILRVIDFWFGLGVDGLRLDAVPYLYEREGTNCENLPETHEFLKKLRAHVDSKFANRMLLGEANQWPEDAAAYFGNGDECHMAFHFPIMPRLFMAIRMEDRFPIVDILEQTPAIPETCQWAIFLRNHDELTLEMVTDEERDYMYRVYAQDLQMRINLGIRRRLAPLLRNDRRTIELMTNLLLSLPGTPVIYYGDEIGMGDNIYLGDRNSLRTPMQWNVDRNAGFSKANPQRLYLPIIIDPEYHYEAVNIEAQQNNPRSLLWWMKRRIALRNRYKAFGQGTLEFLYPENRKVLAFIRRYQDECMLVVANLSRFIQFVELDLSAFRGMIPLEILARTELPPVGDSPYFLTLGPYSFYWFSLEPQVAIQKPVEVKTIATQQPAFEFAGKWDRIFYGETKAKLEDVLPSYLQERRWFGGKARGIRSTQILEIIPVPNTSPSVHITLVQVKYVQGDPEIYVLPLSFMMGEQAEQLSQDFPNAVIARLTGKEKSQEGILYEASVDRHFCALLLEAIARHRRLKGMGGELRVIRTKTYQQIRARSDDALEPVVSKAEQSNTSVVFGEQFILKLFRRLEEGINPDLEIGRFLTRKGFPHIPHVAGALEYYRDRNQSMTTAILHEFVANQGDAWQYTLDILDHFYEYILATRPEVQAIPLTIDLLLEMIDRDVDPAVSEIIGPYLETARLLGQRTAELHVALSSDSDDPDFAPEAFSTHYQRSLYQSMRNLSSQAFQLLRKRINHLPEALRAEAQKVLDLQGEILTRFRLVMGRRIKASRIRCHGDYHLGQVLYTGKDFVIIDFEGEPARSLSDRRIKRSPLRDVAGMIRSYHYAAFAALFAQEPKGLIRQEDHAYSEHFARFWYSWVSIAFLKEYLAVADQASFIPPDREQLRTLLEIYLLEKVLYELSYEINNRPDWVRIPLQGILHLVQPDGSKNE